MTETPNPITDDHQLRDIFSTQLDAATTVPFRFPESDEDTAYAYGHMPAQDIANLLDGYRRRQWGEYWSDDLATDHRKIQHEHALVWSDQQPGFYDHEPLEDYWNWQIVDADTVGAVPITVVYP